MSVTEAAAITTQVALIKDDINKDKKPKEDILNTLNDDLYKKYQRLLQLPARPTLSVGAIYSLVSQKMRELERLVHIQHTHLGHRATDETRRRTPEEHSLAALEIANSETELMTIGKEAQDGINELDRQCSVVEGIFRGVAHSLHQFSLSIVGIVARYTL